MIYYITTCCAEKSTDDGDQPAIERYLDPRIHRVHDQSQQDGAGFLILSGKYGLLHPQTPIPWYDHVLSTSEVAEMVERVVRQLKALEPTSITLFTKPEWYTYNDVMDQSAEKLQIPFRFFFL